MPLIRVATAVDARTVADLRIRWAQERRGEVDAPGFEAELTAWFESELRQRTFWLAEHEAGAIGMANLLTFERMPSPGIDAGRWGYLGNMFVLAVHRNRGVGRQLLDALLAHADSLGLERVVLSPSERSVPFYRSAGFGDAHQLLLRPRTAAAVPPSADGTP